MNKTLDSLQVGQSAIIVKLENQGSIRRRLLDMGMTPGTMIQCVLVSPFLDPVAYKIRNAVVALRRDDSKQIIVEVMDE
ncbi:MAG: FeoA family protein [bacterium]|nr:FeoA family protein [bacterium]